MNGNTKLIAELLDCSLEDAKVWQDRIESWDDIDWSEWSQKRIEKHIINFTSDWEMIYSKAVGA